MNIDFDYLSKQTFADDHKSGDNFYCLVFDNNVAADINPFFGQVVTLDKVGTQNSFHLINVGGGVEFTVSSGHMVAQENNVYLPLEYLEGEEWFQVVLAGEEKEFLTKAGMQYKRWRIEKVRARIGILRESMGNEDVDA